MKLVFLFQKGIVEKMIYKKLLFLFFFTTLGFYYSESKVIEGKVVDENNNPIPYSNVYIIGTSIGVLSNDIGNYRLILDSSIEKKYNEIEASFLGYENKKLIIPKGEKIKLDFVLKEEQIELEEINISAKKKVKRKENPAYEIILEAVKNKKQKTINEIPQYSFKEYSKTSYSISNINELKPKSGFVKLFPEILKYIKESEKTGKKIAPFYFNEKVTKHYYSKNFRKYKVLTEAKKISGFEYPILNDFMERAINGMKFKKSSIFLLGKNFVNPVSFLGQFHYRYYIIDTVFIDDIKCINIGFKPSRKEDLTFRGNVYITVNKKLIKKIDLTVPKDVNINFVNSINIIKSFQIIDNEYFFENKGNIYVDVVFGDKLNGFIATSSFIRTNFNKEIKKEKKFFDGNFSYQDPFSQNKTEEYWKKNRVILLSEEDEKNISNADSLKNSKSVQAKLELFRILFNGYLNVGKFKIGNITSFLSYNEVEGVRLKFGFKTSELLFKKLEIENNIAYGTRDNKFKYQGYGKYILDRKRWQIFSYKLYFDNLDIGQAPSIYVKDHMFFSFKRRFKLMDNYRLTDIKNIKIGFESDVTRDFRLGFNIETKNLSTADKRYNYYINTEKKNFDNTLSSINNNIVSINFRYQYETKNLYKPLNRLSRKYYSNPEINIYTKHSNKSFNSDFSFTKLGVNFQHIIHFSSLGNLQIYLEMDKTFGTIPYPLLNIIKSNEAVFANRKYFNLIDQYEFIGDWSSYLYLEQNFEGFFLNKIPLLKKLKMREFAFIKISRIRLSKANNPNKVNDNRIILLPENTKIMDKKPYTEIGLGIENIMRFFKIIFIARTTYKKPKISDNFVLKFTYKFSF